jgi:hypothetical protein
LSPPTYKCGLKKPLKPKSQTDGPQFISCGPLIIFHLIRIFPPSPTSLKATSEYNTPISKDRNINAMYL